MASASRNVDDSWLETSRFSWKAGAATIENLCEPFYNEVDQGPNS